MIYWIFSTYVPSLPPLASLILLGVVLLTPPAAAWLLGSSGSKSAGSRLSARQRQITWIALPVVGKGALEHASPASPNVLLEIVVGPAGYDAGTLLARAGMALAAGLAAALGAGLLIMDGGPLREQVNRWRDPSRRRGELGSATFCLPGDFARLQRPKPEGLALQGAFWGKRSRHEPADRFYRLDSGPLRSQSGGVRLSVEDRARGLVFIGPAGAGKSQAGILPVAADSLALGHSLILADPQGELTPHILDYASVTGHQVILHDPTEPRLPRYNLAEGIHEVAEAQAITRVLLGSSGRADDPFWQQSAQNLLAACLLRYETLGDILLALSDLQALGRAAGRDAGRRGLSGSQLHRLGPLGRESRQLDCSNRPGLAAVGLGRRDGAAGDCCDRLQRRDAGRGADGAAAPLPRALHEGLRAVPGSGLAAADAGPGHARQPDPRRGAREAGTRHPGRVPHAGEAERSGRGGEPLPQATHQLHAGGADDQPAGAGVRPGGCRGADRGTGDAGRLRLVRRRHSQLCLADAGPLDRAHPHPTSGRAAPPAAARPGEPGGGRHPSGGELHDHPPLRHGHLRRPAGDAGAADPHVRAGRLAGEDPAG